MCGVEHGDVERVGPKDPQGFVKGAWHTEEVSNEEACCAAVRRSQSKRRVRRLKWSGSLTRPSAARRPSSSCEHLKAVVAQGSTRVEAFEGEIQDGADVMKLPGAVETALNGLVPEAFRPASDR